MREARVAKGEMLRCRFCGTPYAELRNGVLIIEQRHHGDKHVNVISVWELVMMALRAMVTGGEREA